MPAPQLLFPFYANPVHKQGLPGIELDDLDALQQLIQHFQSDVVALSPSLLLSLLLLTKPENNASSPLPESKPLSLLIGAPPWWPPSPSH